MLTETERHNVFTMALHQLQAERRLTPVDVMDIIGIRRSVCAECHDRDSDPKYDGAGGMVCDICGADWKGWTK